MRISSPSCQSLLASMTLSAFLVVGCAASESGGPAGSGGSTATGSGGAQGSGGTVGSGGAMGSGGSMMGSGGMVAGSGGSTMDTAPPVDVKAEVAMEVQPETPAGAPTFTELYDTLFGTPAATASSCAGADCHNPGVKDNVNLRTKMMAYTTLLTKVTAGNAANSTLVRRLESTNATMRMPLNKPALTTAQIARVRAWIMAGAKND